jgi:hypothetical protein
MDDGDRVLCAWVDNAASRQRLRLAVIRREGLPFVEENGAQSALDIPDAAGLVEQTHVVCFEHNIVGCDFNFYGPRLPSLARYIRGRGGQGAQHVTFEPLVRRDVVDLLDQYGAVRTFDLRVRRSELGALEQADASLGEALRAQASLSEADEVELILRPRAFSRGENLGQGFFGRVRNLARRDDIADLVQRFVVDAIPADGNGRGQQLNILDDHLIADVQINRRPGRGRALDSASAYDAIVDAYDLLAGQLVEAATFQAAEPAD